MRRITANLYGTLMTFHVHLSTYRFGFYSTTDVRWSWNDGTHIIWKAQPKNVSSSAPAAQHLHCLNRGNRGCARAAVASNMVGTLQGRVAEPPPVQVPPADQVRRSCRTTGKRNCRGSSHSHSQDGRTTKGPVVSHARFTARKTSSATTEKRPCPASRTCGISSKRCLVR